MPREFHRILPQKTAVPNKEYEHRYLTIQINIKQYQLRRYALMQSTSCSLAPHNEKAFTSSYHFLASYTGKELTQ